MEGIFFKNIPIFYSECVSSNQPAYLPPSNLCNALLLALHIDIPEFPKNETSRYIYKFSLISASFLTLCRKISKILSKTRIWKSWNDTRGLTRKQQHQFSEKQMKHFLATNKQCSFVYQCYLSAFILVEYSPMTYL